MTVWFRTDSISSTKYKFISNFISLYESFIFKNFSRARPKLKSVITVNFDNILTKMDYWNTFFLILTYLLTPLHKVLLEKLTGFHLVKQFPTFYGTRKLITAFTSASHLSLSWASSIHSITPHPIFWESILTLSSHLRLGLPSGLFPSGFSIKTLYMPLLSPYVLHAQPISTLRRKNV